MPPVITVKIAFLIFDKKSYWCSKELAQLGISFGQPNRFRLRKHIQDFLVGDKKKLTAMSGSSRQLTLKKRHLEMRCEICYACS